MYLVISTHKLPPFQLPPNPSLSFFQVQSFILCVFLSPPFPPPLPLFLLLSLYNILSLVKATHECLGVAKHWIMGNLGEVIS